MEFRVFPAGFNIVPLKLNQPDGSVMDAVQVTILDVTQQPVHITFGGADWEMFQRAVADPVGEAEREAARARIVSPVGPIPSGRGRDVFGRAREVDAFKARKR